MQTNPLTISLILTISLALSACQPLDIATATPAPQPTLTTHAPEATAATTAEPAASPIPVETEPMNDLPEPQGTVEPGLDPLIALAKEDMAGRLGIQPDEIEVLEARAVMWPDSSLGCPQPGMAYKQVPEDGVLIRLVAGDRTYAYRSGSARGLSLCETPFPTPATAPPRLDPEIEIPPPRDAGGIR